MPLENLCLHSEPEPERVVLKRPPTTTPKHRVTTEELNSFAHDPFQLIGRQFIMDDTEPDGLLYEIVGVGSSKESGKWYEVQLEGTSTFDSVHLEHQEVVNMMMHSILLEV
jgi:hypothetical protein